MEAIAARSELTGTFLPNRPDVDGGLVELLLRSEAADPGRVHLRWPGGQQTVGELVHRARLWAGYLERSGAAAGDRVALLGTNSAETIALQLATQLCGAVEVPVNSELRGRLLHSVLQDADPRLVLVSDRLPGDLLESLPFGTPHFRLVDDALRAEVESGRAYEGAVTGSPGTPAHILYTSGTTGPSKGVILPRGYFPQVAANWIAPLELSASDVTYFCTPFFHVDAHVWHAACLITGATFGFTERFSVSRFWTESAAMGATTFLAVGAMASALVARRPGAPPRHTIRRAAIAPIPAEVFPYLEEELGIELLQIYGQTEADGVVFETMDRRRRGSAGWACCGYDVRIVDDDDESVPVGTTGRVVFRPNHPHMITLGYFNRPEATAESSRNMWWHTGDLAHVDEDGFFWFDGRASDSIRRRGENISAWELEAAIREHESVRSVAVVPVPDEIGGEDAIKVFLTVAEGAEWSPRAFFDFCAAQLPRFAQPRYVQVVDEADLVRGPGTGAIQKHLLGADEASTIDREDV
jgi:crotonobetaine/carnitine-CoA ligase